MRGDRADRGFRDDINGMRAIAVIGVVAYHFGVPPFRGGFVGVDVFFVISGFLMTQIIAGRLDTGRFSFADFYLARVRRIVPALVAVIFCVLLAGYLTLDPLRLEVLAQDAFWSHLFASNFLYFGQGGYFAAAADQNWLLHTWSLAVEWQFYILYPIVLYGLSRTRARAPIIVGALALLAALSLVETLASIHQGGCSLTLSFYMIWRRAWEFLVGGLCVYALPLLRFGAASRGTAHALGLATIATSMVVIESRTSVWPSALTGLPVAGAALMLLADVRQPRWARTTVVASLGRWSYSIYLWHWPVAAMSSSFGFRSPVDRAAGIGASIVLGFLSYRLVEGRFTDYLWERRSRLRMVGVPAFGLSLALALVALASNGLESIRFAFHPHMLARLRDYRAAANDWMSPRDCGVYLSSATGFTECKFGNPMAHDTLVIGDSFAEQLIPRYKGMLTGDDAGITFVVRGGCVPISGFERIPFGSDCDRWVKEAYAYARREDFKRVVFVAFWSAYDRNQVCLVAAGDCGAKLDDAAFAKALDAGYARMAEEWRALKDQGKDVVAVEEPPFGKGDPTELYRQALAGRRVETVETPLVDFEAAKTAAPDRLGRAATVAGAGLVDPAAALCPAGQCIFVENGRALYKDAFHFRASMMKGARFAVFDRYILPGAMPRASLN